MSFPGRVVVVGGGVLGTMHAIAARRRGFEVVQLEREAEALPDAERRGFELLDPATAGVYSEVASGGAVIYHRSEVAPGVVLVTGPGGRGMTCSPAIAEETFG
jgi:glycine/D-amino acid oxidase-like deaminating enzyme